MNTYSRLIAPIVCGTLVSLALVQPAAAVSPTPKKSAEPADVVDLFAGMESGAIEVKMFAKDSTEGTITVKNKSGKPLTIKMPAAFAGVPVAAQMMGGMGGMGGGGMGGGGMGGGGGGNQGIGGGMGGGMGGMGGGMGGGGMGGGMFNVAPEKATKLKFACVCLDHGKKDPNPRIAYKIVPIDSYAKNPAVTETIKLMLQGKLDQHSAQAATWHLQNGLSWKQLATKIGAKHLDGSVEPYFTAKELQQASAAVGFAQDRAEKLVGSQPTQQPTSIGIQAAH